MPVLSAASLIKRFTCPYCNRSLRTRQGLSGHIHFKHDDGRVGHPPSRITSLDRELEMRKNWAEAAIPLEWSRYEFNANINTLKKWREAQILCGTLGVALNAADFKNYLVSSLAAVNADHSLYQLMVQSIELYMKKQLDELEDRLVKKMVDALQKPK